MSKKSNSIKKQNVKKRKFGIIHIAILVFGVYFVYTLVQQQIQINKYNSQIEMYSADIKVYTGQVSRIMSQAPELLDTVFPALVPPYLVCLLQQHLGYGCCPAAASQYCNLSYHSQLHNKHSRHTQTNLSYTVHVAIVSWLGLSI